jgi:hypothetical protein
MNVAKKVRKCVSAFLLAGMAAVPAAAQVSVLTQHNDIARTGANLGETMLNTTTVNVNQFGKLFTRAVDGYIYAQPLVVANVSIPNQGTRNVVYAATEHNSVFAFDADSATASTSLWHVNLGPSVPSADVQCGDLTPEVGITSTPVIDQSTGTIYVVAKSKELVGATFQYFQRLHALDIASGAEKFGGPVVIQDSVTGTGDGGGTVSFNPLLEHNRPGLLLLNGLVYVAFASHCDTNPYHGWVLGYDASTLQQVAVHNSTPNGGQGGIWQSGQGLLSDGNGYLYFITGNGTFDANTGGIDYGDSFVKLSTPGLVVVDWFTPYNQSVLNKKDADLGSGGPLWLPGTSRIVGGGKGTFDVVDTTNMGHFNSRNNNDQIGQSFQATTGAIWGSPIYWNSPNNGPVVYLFGQSDFLKAYKLVNGAFQTVPVSASKSKAPNFPGGILSLSANGSAAGTGIIWASTSNANANRDAVPGTLHAFDATNLAKELWNSAMNSTRDAVGNYAKFCPPTIANGKVYLATFSGYLAVYGLLP